MRVHSIDKFTWELVKLKVIGNNYCHWYHHQCRVIIKRTVIIKQFTCHWLFFNQRISFDTKPNYRFILLFSSSFIFPQLVDITNSSCSISFHPFWLSVTSLSLFLSIYLSISPYVRISSFSLNTYLAVLISYGNSVLLVFVYFILCWSCFCRWWTSKKYNRKLVWLIIVLWEVAILFK